MRRSAVRKSRWRGNHALQLPISDKTNNVQALELFSCVEGHSQIANVTLTSKKTKHKLEMVATNELHAKQCNKAHSKTAMVVLLLHRLRGLLFRGSLSISGPRRTNFVVSVLPAPLSPDTSTVCEERLCQMPSYPMAV